MSSRMKLLSVCWVALTFSPPTEVNSDLHMILPISGIISLGLLILVVENIWTKRNIDYYFSRFF